MAFFNNFFFPVFKVTLASDTWTNVGGCFLHSSFVTTVELTFVNPEVFMFLEYYQCVMKKTFLKMVFIFLIVQADKCAIR